MGSWQSKLRFYIIMFTITKKTTNKTYIYINIDGKKHFLASGKKDMFSYSSTYQNLHFALSNYFLNNNQKYINNVKTLNEALQFVKANYFDKYLVPNFKIS